MVSGSKTPAEYEMDINQRDLVDNVVEEAQYEDAIDTLFQLRSPSYKPDVSHIQQLIFLALHSPRDPASKGNDVSVNDSPKKTKNMASHSPITAKVVTSALELLRSFLLSNSPEALGRALPSRASRDPTLPSPYAANDQPDSLLAKQALCIKTAKHCWEFLEDGYIYRTQVITSPKGRSKLQRGYSNEALQSNEAPGGSHLVGNHSWPILEWLVSLFEKDEELNEQSNSVRYSPILLEQLPPPRGDSVMRWDFSDILNIIVRCFQQEHIMRQNTGYRLIAMLINLTNTPHVDTATLVASVYKCFVVKENPDLFESLLSNLPSSPSGWVFKTYLCLKLCTERPVPDLKPQDRPRARAPPRPRPTGPGSPIKQAKTPVETPKQSLPPATEVLQCLESPVLDQLPKALTPSLLLRAKFELVTSFAAAQNTNTVEGRLDWDRLIQDGQLTQAINKAFPPEVGDSEVMYSQMLQEVLRLSM